MRLAWTPAARSAALTRVVRGLDLPDLGTVAFVASRYPLGVVSTAGIVISGFVGILLGLEAVGLRLGVPGFVLLAVAMYAGFQAMSRLYLLVITGAQVVVLRLRPITYEQHSLILDAPPQLIRATQLPSLVDLVFTLETGALSWRLWTARRSQASIDALVSVTSLQPADDDPAGAVHPVDRRSPRTPGPGSSSHRRWPAEPR